MRPLLRPNGVRQPAALLDRARAGTIRAAATKMAIRSTVAAEGGSIVLDEREGALMWPERFGPAEIASLESSLGPYMSIRPTAAIAAAEGRRALPPRMVATLGQGGQWQSLSGDKLSRSVARRRLHG